MTKRIGYSSLLNNDRNGRAAGMFSDALLKSMDVENICHGCGGYTYLKAEASALFSVLQSPEPAHSAVPQSLHHHIQHQCFLQEQPCQMQPLNIPDTAAGRPAGISF
jgi:hypothetical protein